MSYGCALPANYSTADSNDRIEIFEIFRAGYIVVVKTDKEKKEMVYDLGTPLFQSGQML